MAKTEIKCSKCGMLEQDSRWKFDVVHDLKTDDILILCDDCAQDLFAKEEYTQCESCGEYSPSAEMCHGGTKHEPIDLCESCYDYARDIVI